MEDPANEGQVHVSFNTDFYLRMAKRVLLNQAENCSNFVFSPLSFHASLSLIVVGSKGRTLEQLLSSLGTNSNSDANMLFSRLVAVASAINEDPQNNNIGGPLLSFVNSIWVDQKFPLKPTFIEIAHGTFRAEAKQVDFQTKVDEVRIEVNSCVEEATKGLIKELIPSGSLDSTTALVLANALYFKGSWDRKFDASKTQERAFYLPNGETVRVPFMTVKQYHKQLYRHYDSDGFKVLKLPYQNGHDEREFSMYFFLPDQNDGLLNLVDMFSSNTGFFEQHLELREEDLTHFWIPRFKISFGFEASETMKQLGLTFPFMDVGELTELVDSPHSAKLYVSQIFHKACIEVNEEGTEAAASTAPRFVKMMRIASPPTFVADHPFLFMIREEISGLVFFTGAVLNPLV